MVSLALTCVASVSSFADEVSCPDRSVVLSSGVAVDFADGSRMVYALTNGAEDRVIEIYRSPQRDDGFWVESLRGVYPIKDGYLELGAPDLSTFSESKYSAPLESLPAPTPGTSWTGEIEEVDSRGVVQGQTSLTVTFGGRRTLTIGECAYAAIPTETLYADAEGGYQGTLDYLPALGIAIQTAGGQLGQLLEFYHPISITAARPG